MIGVVEGMFFLIFLIKKGAKMLKKILILIIFISFFYTFLLKEELLLAFPPPSEPKTLGWEDDVCLTPGMNIDNHAYPLYSNWATATPDNRVYSVWYRRRLPSPSVIQVITRWWDQIGSWSQEETVSVGGFTFADIFHPSISSDSNNNIHFLWRGQLTFPSGWWLFYRAKLANGNYTNICSLPTKADSHGTSPVGYPHIAGGKGDTAHCVFQIFWDSVYRIGYAKILPTYPSPMVLDIDTVSPMSWPVYSYSCHLAVDGQNRIHVVWEADFRIVNSIRNIFYRMRDANGQWGSVEVVSEFPNSYYNYYPRVAVDNNGDIHVVWSGRTTDTSYYRIFHRVKTSSGWSEVTIFPEPPTYEWLQPTCAVSPDNKLHIAFVTAAWGPGYNLGRLIRNPDGSWEGPDTVTRFSDGYYRYAPEIIATRDGKIHIFRKDFAPYTNNYYHIFYKRWIPSSGIEEENNKILTIIKEKGRFKIFYSLPTKMLTNLTIYNILGKIVYQAKSDNGYFVIDTKKWPTSIYLMKFNANKYQVTRKLIIY